MISFSIFNCFQFCLSTLNRALVIVCHALRVNDARARLAGNTGVVDLDKQGLDFLNAGSDNTRESGITNRMTADQKVSVRGGFMHDAEHLDPEAARLEGYQPKGLIAAPVAGIEFHPWLRGAQLRTQSHLSHFSRLHLEQLVARFSIVSAPPFDLGVT